MNFVMAIIALTTFALYDYFGFNTLGQKNLPLYRKTQWVVAFLIIVPLFLYRPSYTLIDGDSYYSWVSVVLAVLLWWTFNSDFLFYVFCWVIPVFKNVPRDSFEQQVMGDKVIWAWWTPVGILMGRVKNRTVPIRGEYLVFQAAVGTVITLLIQLTLVW